MLARFERLMEQAVEGSLRRVFPSSLQPIQLAKAAARSMEQAQVVGVSGADVPNVYELRLAPTDLGRFGEYRDKLVEDIRVYLVDYARERGLRPVGEPKVRLIEDATLRDGTLRADARFEGLSAAARQAVETAVEGTRRLRLAELADARSGRAEAQTPVPLRLRDAAGLDIQLEADMDVVRVGRAADNDVVLGSQRVSRYHAQLRCVDTNWLLYDLDSTNGTWLDEQRLAGKPGLLRAGSRVRLGDYELEVASTDIPRGRS